MIDYIINYQEERVDSRTQVRYPFLVSECFSAENTTLVDFLFNQPEQAEEPPKPEQDTDGTPEPPVAQAPNESELRR